MDAQALQQGLQGMSLQQQAPQHSMQSVDPFDMRAYGSAHAMDPNQVSTSQGLPRAAAHWMLNASVPAEGTARPPWPGSLPHRPMYCPMQCMPSPLRHQ